MKQKHYTTLLKFETFREVQDYLELLNLDNLIDVRIRKSKKGNWLITERNKFLQAYGVVLKENESEGLK